jgi:hypothetical protein
VIGLNEWLFVAAGVIGAVIGVIAHYAYIIWQRRDIISWTIDFWVRAWEDKKVTVDEVLQFVEGLIDRLGLRDKVVVQKK